MSKPAQNISHNWFPKISTAENVWNAFTSPTAGFKQFRIFIYEL